MRLSRKLTLCLAILTLFSVNLFADTAKSIEENKEGTKWTFAIKDAKGKILFYREEIIHKRVGDSNNFYIVTETAKRNPDGSLGNKGLIVRDTARFVAGVKLDDSLVKEKMIKDLKMELGEENISIKTEGELFDVTDKLKIGDTFNPLKLNVKLSILTVDVAINDIFVANKESINLAGKSFDCIVMQYTESVKIPIILNETVIVKEWCDTKYNIVRSENYKKNGKLVSSLELVSIEKL